MDPILEARALRMTFADPFRAQLLALDGIRPNPARGVRLTVAFALPDAGPARLELLDITGRLLASRDVGGLGAGLHEVDLAEGRVLPPGVHVVRLTHGTLTLTRKAIVLR